MRVSDRDPQVLLDGLRFAEAPRWHAGWLWFSDIFAHRVMRVDVAGSAEVVVDLGEDLPSGLGFMPDGTLLIACLNRPVLLSLAPAGGLSVHAELAGLAVGGLNDMLVDDRGRAYVGSMGTHGAHLPRPVCADGNIILVEPDGSARVVAEEMDAPNGPCLTSDGQTYVVAEFPASRLIAFDRLRDGGLAHRRLWADLRPGSADGITVDSKGAIWTASPREHECRRVLEGGAVTDRVAVGDRLPLACALGGPEGRTLFICSAVGGEDAVRSRTCTSLIETATVDVPAR